VHCKRGAHRALGVVLVRDGRAEDRHDVVADVLVDRPAEALDLLAEAAQAAVDHRLHELGIHALGHCRVAGDVGEQDGDPAPFLGQRGVRDASRLCHGRGQSSAALHAELLAGAVRRRAAGAQKLQLRPAVHAELRIRRVLRSALGARGHSRIVTPAAMGLGD
jgi:hypothetical protein